MPREVIDLTVPTTFTEVEDTPVWPALQVAIDEAQPHRLRETLRRLCMDSRDTARAAQAILVVPVQRSRSKTNMAEEEEDEDQDEDKDDEPDESESDSSSKNEAAEAEAISNTLQGLKRMRPRYVRCRNCKEEFDITQNESGDCSYHPEETEDDWDGDFWADHDEDCHGTIDTEEMRGEYPEGFIYPCCNGNGESEGCKTSRHIEEVPGAKRRFPWTR